MYIKSFDSADFYRSNINHGKSTEEEMVVFLFVVNLQEALLLAHSNKVKSAFVCLSKLSLSCLRSKYKCMC